MNRAVVNIDTGPVQPVEAGPVGFSRREIWVSQAHLCSIRVPSVDRSKVRRGA